MLMTHLFKKLSCGDGLSTVDVECSKLGLGRGRHDGLDNLGDGEDGAVVVGVGNVAVEEKMPPCPAACSGFGQIGGITVGGQYHVAGAVSDGRVGVSGGVVEQLFDLF